ncbi:hypothetical protein FH603_2735 [Spirosoma sp. LMG 31447]|uniref:Uncharacterized protein n=1 Tax=Spirosoma utsteinense TaxID=2585773 RepID=A0ABR6W6N5_9BACT|nr:hypothetical protein [Spirosoma utsteinense]
MHSNRIGETYFFERNVGCFGMLPTGPASGVDP